MDIQIVHNGVQMGPFNEETIHAMLKSGSVLVNDLAWRPGYPDWVPLMNILYPAAAEPAPAAPPAERPAPEPREPATAKQKALLSFMSVTFAPDISREDASLLVNDTMENPSDPARLARWNEERLRLHPELFAPEIQARKEGRPHRFLEICHAEGAPYFDKVTKAHCQVLVGHLDVRSPHWDSNENEATWKYFFPALAEKFPQILTEEGRGKFKSPEQPAAASKQAKSTPVTVRARASSSPGLGRIIYAFARGVFVGLIILGLLWVGRGFFVKKARPVKKAMMAASSEPAVETDSVASAPPATEPPAKEPEAPKVETPKPIAETPPTEPAPAPAAATAEPAMPASEQKTAPATGEAPAKAEMAGIFATPEPAAPPAARTSVLLTKPIPITLQFGQINVPAGTPVKIVSQNGVNLTVKYLEHVVTIPASSTDLGTEPAGAATAKAAAPQ